MAVKKIHREDILKASVTVMETQGYERLSVRNIAAELHSSTQPIYSEFHNINHLKEELLHYISEHYLKTSQSSYLCKGVAAFLYITIITISPSFHNCNHSQQMFAKFSQYTKIPCCAHAQQGIFFNINTILQQPAELQPCRSFPSLHRDLLCPCGRKLPDCGRLDGAGRGF